MSSDNLLIFGASVRAAAFSALRAGLQPWCADLFADADLTARCPTMVVPPELYPHGFLSLASKELPGPWMYTGGLENYRLLVQFMAAVRPLWGNDETRLALARSPVIVAALLRSAGLPGPAVGGDDVLRKRSKDGRRWLVKPLIGSGGSEIRWFSGTPRQMSSMSLATFRSNQGVPPITAARDQVYLQEYIEGQPCAAIYVGDGRDARLLGVTRQLVGEPWLHAAPFHYCGSIGPLPLEPATTAAFTAIGRVLAKGCRLVGLFGVDCILRDGTPYPVEVNPRYTASVELLEYATGMSAVAAHRAVFEPAPASGGHSSPVEEDPWTVAPPRGAIAPRSPVVGKAIVFARATFAFPTDGPWMATLRRPPDVWEPPAFADIPAAGQVLSEGKPVLTIFARAESVAECRALLEVKATEVSRCLFGE